MDIRDAVKAGDCGAAMAHVLVTARDLLRPSVAVMAGRMTQATGLPYRHDVWIDWDTNSLRVVLREDK